jgi:hypothetical protein
MTLPLVLYVSEVGFLMLREELRLRVYEEGFPSGIIGPKKDEIVIVFGWRKLNNEELHNL